MIGRRQNRVRRIGEDLRTGVDGRQHEAGRQRRQLSISGRRETGGGIGMRACRNGSRGSFEETRERHGGRPTGLRESQAREYAKQCRQGFSRPCGIEPPAERPGDPECGEGFGRRRDPDFPNGTRGSGSRRSRPPRARRPAARPCCARRPREREESRRSAPQRSGSCRPDQPSTDGQSASPRRPRRANGF